MKIKLLTLFFLVCAIGMSRAQETPAHVDNILAKAYKTAKKQNKKVFVKFTASWCGWCRKMDASMKKETTKKLFDDEFVSVSIVVKEHGDKKSLENPGGNEMIDTYAGQRSGIPFWLIFDADGTLLADAKYSKENPAMIGVGSNLGCPATQDEVNGFLYKLKNTTNLTDKQLKIIAEEFRKNDPSS